MLSTLVMTVIGADRPGLVQAVSAVVADHGGNWLESRMCRLGGRFAGLLRVEVPLTRRDELMVALRALEGAGLSIVVQTEETAGMHVPRPTAGGRGQLAELELVGQDRPGILRSVSAVFARHGVNVEELSSERVSAPMGGGTLFQARARVLFPVGVSRGAVQADLERIAADLMVDVRLRAS